MGFKYLLKFYMEKTSADILKPVDGEYMETGWGIMN